MSRTVAGRTVRQPTDGTTIMMRSILIAAVAGVLTAVLASYFLTAPARQSQTATLASPDNSVSRVANAAEAWPICSTMAAMVETPDWAALDPDFAAGKRAIGAGDWEGAIKALTNAALRDARNADIGTQTTPQTILKQWMKAILFTARVACDCHENIRANQSRQRHRCSELRIQFRARLYFDSIEQSNAR